MPKTIDQILDSASLPERAVKICMNQRLRSEWEQVTDELEEMNLQATADADREASSLAAGFHRQRRVLAERVLQLEQQMADDTIEFLLRGLPFAKYNALLIKHPPREGNQADGFWGFNSATFYPALIPACTVEPELTPEQWERIEGSLSDRQYDELANAALEVNRRVDGSVPFSRSASEVMRGSAETSTSLSRSE